MLSEQGVGRRLYVHMNALCHCSFGNVGKL